MDKLIKLEEASMLILSIIGLAMFKVEWWCYLLLLLGPDISMIGYVAGNKTGALCYNLFHHKGVAVLCFATALYIHNPTLQIAGIILFGHSAFDRVFGYGLKFNKGFGYTHLGLIGKVKMDQLSLIKEADTNA